jgi:esterase/lipase superfamily enzyme
MVKKLFTLLFAAVLAVPLSALFVQVAPAQEKMGKMAKEDRWEGVIVRSSSDKSTLTVRKVGSSVEKTVQYDSSTKWVSQEHGSKKVNDIDASQVKDGDRVICLGSYDKDGVLHATTISKRLSHPSS